MKKLILLSLVLAASLMLVGCGNQKAFAGQASGFGLGAESCDGDDTCETSSLYVDSNAIVQGTINSWELKSGRIIISSLIGKGNSYACLDEQGLIFRSDIPCR